MKNKTIKTAVLSIAMVCSALAGAQGRNELPNQPYLTLAEQSTSLLNYASIRESLSLSKDENRAIDAELKSYAAAQQKLFGKATPASDEQVQAMDHAHAHAILASLSQAHRDRLFQILLQAKGSEALEDKVIASRVGLSPAKLVQIHQIFKVADEREDDFEATLAKKLLAVPRIAPSSLYQQKRMAVVNAAVPERQQLEKARSADEAKVFGLLSPAQKSKWKGLLGVPFPLTHYKD